LRRGRFWEFLWLGILILGTSSSKAGLWTTGYYPGYRQTYLPSAAIDYGALTHIIHFAVAPAADGTLNSAANGITPARSADLIAHAHASGCRVLICLGGAGSQAGFRGATSPANLSNFVGIPSADGLVKTLLAAGMSAQKLSVGIAFYGNVWAGGTGTSTGGAALPRQSWVTAPTNTAIAFFDLISMYHQSNLYHWDTNAQAAYLSIDSPGAANDRFISFDDEHACRAKVSYARSKGLGGVMIWELGQGFRPDQPVGKQAPLLQAVKQGMETPRFDLPRIRGTDLELTFTSLPLATYQVDWVANPAAGVWNPLTWGSLALGAPSPSAIPARSRTARNGFTG